ncbi:replication initiation and membrane attachment family protein [Peribacillus alkalitolerans]|uniref:replication initiation and membrane attachment family protein n=1 Tax=Peribacillus alkalitolerans TaxID=1550385 RepID=UPI0013D2868D|nr:replication initiation and membrane attachment family protein [Peribacillus alkalitolerans]
MSKHWQELVPVDSYEISSSGLLHDYDRKVIALLYQPLIGSIAMSLYFTFWSELEQNRIWSSGSSFHRGLMNVMSLNLSEIYDARKKLEGIGLLKVWRKKSEDRQHFIYELQPPLTPEEFLHDGMLNIYLHKRLGKQHYQKLKEFFSDKVVDEKEYEPVTKSFSDVFISGHLESLYVSDESKEDLVPEPSHRYIGRQEGSSPIGFEESFDFNLFFAGLSSTFVSKKAFAPKVKEAIAKIAFLYGINPLQMQGLVLRSVDENKEVNIEALRKNARDWYQVEYQDDLPSLAERVQPPHLHSLTSEPRNEEEKHIKHLETVSPLKRLKELSGGAEPSKSDITIVEGIMMNQQLPPGVVNVLIEYVMIKTDMKLTKGYVDKIAGHWARKNIKTVIDAMDLAKKENQQYLSWQEEKKNKQDKPSRQKKVVRQEYIPDWMSESKTTETSSDGEELSPELEQKRKELEEKIKRLKKR